jgi:hypothetical protein
MCDSPLKVYTIVGGGVKMDGNAGCDELFCSESAMP